MLRSFCNVTRLISIESQPKKVVVVDVVVVTTPTQPQLNSKVGCDMKMTLIHHHHPPPPPTTTHTNSMSVISLLLLTRFQPNLKGRFVGSTTTITRLITMMSQPNYIEIIVTTPTQPQHNSKVGCDMKMTLIHHHHHHPPPTQTQCQQYLSCLQEGL